MKFGETDIGDPASLPTRDGKPVLPGDEIECCGTCGYCRLRVDDAKQPFAICIFEGDPRYKKIGLIEMHPVDPEQKGCAEWKTGLPYARRKWIYWWRRRCENDFDCQMERKKELKLEAQDYTEGLKEDRCRGAPGPRIPKSGGRYDRG